MGRIGPANSTRSPIGWGQTSVTSRRWFRCDGARSFSGLVARRCHLETVRHRPVVLPVQAHQAAEEGAVEIVATRQVDDHRAWNPRRWFSDRTANSWRAGLSRSVPRPSTWTKKPEAVRPTRSIGPCASTLMAIPPSVWTIEIQTFPAADSTSSSADLDPNWRARRLAASQGWGYFGNQGHGLGLRSCPSGEREPPHQAESLHSSSPS